MMIVKSITLFYVHYRIVLQNWAILLAKSGRPSHDSGTRFLLWCPQNCIVCGLS
jgi:hypothetical protein